MNQERASPQILGITVSKMPYNTCYDSEDCVIDLTGGELSIVYADGDMRVVPMVDDMETEIRDNNVVVSCFGKTAKFPITLIVEQTEEKSKKEPQERVSLKNSKYPYIPIDWQIRPYYAATTGLRFVDDPELEEIYESEEY